MDAKNFLSVGALLSIVAIAAIASAQAPGQNADAPPGQSASVARQDSAPQSDYVLKVRTHVITVDVVATDSSGNAVRDLNQNDFEISDNGRQKITQFSFVDKSGSEAAPGATGFNRNGMYRNVARNLTVPPTILLVDSLNTPLLSQTVMRRFVMQVTRNLPPGTPIAVLALGVRLGIVENFTSDPAVLRAALGQGLTPTDVLEENPEDDSTTVSDMFLRETAQGAGTGARGGTERDYRAQLLKTRVATTIDALKWIADWVKGYPGRKDLIWISTGFPSAVLPGTGRASFQNPQASSPIAGLPNTRPGQPAGATMGGGAGARTGTFRETVNYNDDIQKALEALADAQVAVYPVDPRGLDPDRAFGGREMAQGTMIELAEGTGGKECINTNDLSGCAAEAVKDSSSYYELAYYPENVIWNGSFHKISVKTKRGGIHLSYRRGYFAMDEDALAKQEPSEKRLQEACSDLLAPTAIPISAEAAPQDKPGELRYIMGVPATALDLGPGSGSRDLKLDLGICRFAANEASYQLSVRSLSRSVTETAYQDWQKVGFRELVDLPPAEGMRRFRLAVFDERSGLTGAVDIPVWKADIEKVQAQPAAAQGASQAAGTAAAPAAAPPEQPNYSVGFHASSGTSSALDWNGDKLWYHGEIGVENTAPIFFRDTFFAKFHCEAGVLAPRDPASNEEPKLEFIYKNPAGHAAVVDLAGSEPKYSGELAIDPSAKAFFGRLWYLCHCRAAPEPK